MLRCGASGLRKQGLRTGYHDRGGATPPPCDQRLLTRPACRVDLPAFRAAAEASMKSGSLETIDEAARLRRTLSSA